MVVNIELTEVDLKVLVKEHITELTNMAIELSHIKIEVKSEQNYKSEWETAKFRAVYHMQGVV